jgi:hypothetical protein
MCSEGLGRQLVGGRGQRAGVPEAKRVRRGDDVAEAVLREHPRGAPPVEPEPRERDHVIQHERAPIALFASTVLIARNLRVADAFAAQAAEEERRASRELPPKQRRRRRQSAGDMIGAASAPP